MVVLFRGSAALDSTQSPCYFYPKNGSGSLLSLLSRSRARQDVKFQGARVLSAANPRHQSVNADNSDQAVKRALQLAERGARKAAPVDPKDAAKGKLDFVQVKGWGSGEAAALENLQVDSFSGAMIEDAQPFYVSLARQLELLEAQGALQAARPQGSQQLPPFERWSMAGPRYAQFLVDLHHVHAALEAALAAAPAAARLKHYDDQEPCRRVLQALSCFAAHTGMHRSSQIASDLAAISACSWLPSVESTQPTGHALATGQALQSLANACSRSDARGWAKAALRLMANAYCIYVTNLSMGTRIGSAAAEKLNLFKAQAVQTWRGFPAAAGRNPVVTFAEHVNTAGTYLTQQQRQSIIDELAAAMIRTSMLLSTLSHED